MEKKESNRVVKCVIDVERNQIRFDIKGEEGLVCDLGKVSQENLKYAALHGFKQRLTDAAAISCDTTTGKSASAGEKAEMIKRLIAHYESGSVEWSVEREGGGGVGRVSYLAEAVAEVKGLEVGAVREWLKGRTAAEKAALEQHPQIKKIIDGKKAQKVAGVDSGKLLDSLGGVK